MAGSEIHASNKAKEKESYRTSSEIHTNLLEARRRKATFEARQVTKTQLGANNFRVQSANHQIRIMVADPYRALNLPHSATDEQIKKSYRDLARRYHPDRLRQRAAASGGGGCAGTISESERDQATAQFAKISAAYDLLTDPQRKAHYDHVYRYGGYDDVEDDDDDDDVMQSRRKVQCASSTDTGPVPAQSQYQQHQNGPSSARRKRKSTGIGYACVDPLAFLWTNGRIQKQMAVAGIQIPSRLGMANAAAAAASSAKSSTNPAAAAAAAGGFRFAFSSGHFSTSPTTGLKQYKTQTTQFCHGKKYTRTETTTIYPDGRREVVIEGNDYYERRFVTPPPGAGASAANLHRHADDVTQPKKDEPWYTNAWSEMKSKLTMCYNPCMVTQ